MGLNVLLVGRNGRSYTREQWPQSHTFRMSDQENLLVADNQTQAYEQADEATRREMSERTWGREAMTTPAKAAVNSP
jgi:hypothetical protein